MTNTLQLRTPEGISFSLLLASPVIRFLAWTIDCACILALSGTIQKIVSSVSKLNQGLADASLVLLYFAISIGYGIACEWLLRGQTLGKRILRLRVMDSEGLHLQFSQVLVRNLLRFVDALPVFYLVGGAVCLLSERSQRLGDIAANTIVVRQMEAAQPDAAAWMEGKYNSLLEHRHLAARLRQRVTPQLAATGLEALVRRDQLTPEARLELFGELADRFRELVPFPEEAVGQLSDEQYVRNVVEVLYRTTSQN
jgi:uncharacterized RDD family membrane protein YckC